MGGQALASTRHTGSLDFLQNGEERVERPAGFIQKVDFFWGRMNDTLNNKHQLTITYPQVGRTPPNRVTVGR